MTLRISDTGNMATADWRGRLVGSVAQLDAVATLLEDPDDYEVIDRLAAEWIRAQLATFPADFSQAERYLILTPAEASYYGPIRCEVENILDGSADDELGGAAAREALLAPHILNPETHPDWVGCDVVVSEHGNGNATRYVVVGGTYYHADTPAVVVSALEHSRVYGTRLRIEYGYANDEGPDKPAGRAWGGGGLAIGRIGRSMGPIAIPLEIKNSRSSGGGPILDNCIVRITGEPDGRLWYQHPAYQPTGEVVYRAPLDDWERIAAALPPQIPAKVLEDDVNGRRELNEDSRPLLANRLIRDTHAILPRARKRGVKSCEVWLSAGERVIVDAVAAELGITPKQVPLRF